jgi:hypothetical protein
LRYRAKQRKRTRYTTVTHMADEANAARLLDQVMENIERNARRLIIEHGEDAAGEAFGRALEARVSARQDEADRWLEIAVEVMRQDRVGQRVEIYALQ